MDNRTKDKIRKDIVSLYKKDPSKLARIFETLADSNAGRNDPRETLLLGKNVPNTSPPIWTELRQAQQSNKKRFKKLLESIITTSLAAANNSHFIVRLRDIIILLLRPRSLEQAQNGLNHGKASQRPRGNKYTTTEKEIVETADWNVMLLRHHRDNCSVLSNSGVVQAWHLIPEKYKGRLLINLNSMVASAIVQAERTLVNVGLAAVHLTWSCFYYIRRWYRGEISGKRCAKKCVDSLTSIAAGVGGAILGATAGSMMFPGVGTFIGGLVGGIGAEYFTSKVMNKLTTEIFDLAPSDGLDKAFEFLNIHHRSGNEEINRTFRKLCLKYHPDKGGDPADFHKLQFHMSVIKISRGE